MAIPTSLSLDQADVLRKIAAWMRTQDKPYFTVGGYAGTGKSTLAAILRKLIHKKYPSRKVAFASYTGRASQNLSLKLKQAQAEYPQDTCGTIHKLIYRIITNSDGVMTGQRKKEELEYDLIIIDEASMVTRNIWYDLLSYNIPILAIGDHGQLPPIGETFNLMETPMSRLEKVHRQAADNPIIALANQARQGEELSTEFNKGKVQVMPRSSPEAGMLMETIFNSFDDETLILCGTNKLRNQLNGHLRAQLGREEPTPMRGDRVVCLKNIYDNKTGSIYNGMIGNITELEAHEEHWFQVVIEFPLEEKKYSGLISKYQFGATEKVQKVPGLDPKKIGDLFDFGYAITVHKAQGSQARRVLLFDESYIFKHKNGAEEAKKWLYTAITRAEEELYVLV